MSVTLNPISGCAVHCFLDKRWMEPGDYGPHEMTQAVVSAKVGDFIRCPEMDMCMLMKVERQVVWGLHTVQPTHEGNCHLATVLSHELRSGRRRTTPHVYFSPSAQADTCTVVHTGTVPALLYLGLSCFLKYLYLFVCAVVLWDLGYFLRFLSSFDLPIRQTTYGTVLYCTVLESSRAKKL